MEDVVRMPSLFAGLWTSTWVDLCMYGADKGVDDGIMSCVRDRTGG